MCSNYSCTDDGVGACALPTTSLAPVQLFLKIRSCKSYNSKYMTASTQIAKTEIFAFVAMF